MRVRFIFLIFGTFLFSACERSSVQPEQPFIAPHVPDIKVEAAFVNSDSVNLRSEGSVSSKVLDKLDQYEVVDILATSSTSEMIDGNSGSWWKVKRNDVVGFVFSPFLSAIEPGEDYMYPDNQNEWATQKFNNSLDQARFNESRILEALPQRVIRDQGKVSITCDNGNILDFIDSGGEKGLKYSINDYFLSRFILVETQYYEGTSSQLLNLENGKVIDVVGSAWRVDNSKRWAVFLNADTEYSFPGLQVIDLSSFQTAFSAKVPAYDVVWMSDLGFEALVNSMPTSEYKTYRYKMFLTFKDSTWQTDGRKIKI